MPKLTMPKLIIWCFHNGKTTYSQDCPYTIKHRIQCSMPHIDQPNGKFKDLN